MKAILSGRISRDIARGGGAGRGAGLHPVTDIGPLPAGDDRLLYYCNPSTSGVT